MNAGTWVGLASLAVLLFIHHYAGRWHD